MEPRAEALARQPLQSRIDPLRVDDPRVADGSVHRSLVKMNASGSIRAAIAFRLSTDVGVAKR